MLMGDLQLAIPPGFPDALHQRDNDLAQQTDLPQDHRAPIQNCLQPSAVHRLDRRIRIGHQLRGGRGVQALGSFIRGPQGAASMAILSHQHRQPLRRQLGNVTNAVARIRRPLQQRQPLDLVRGIKPAVPVVPFGIDRRIPFFPRTDQVRTQARFPGHHLDRMP